MTLMRMQMHSTPFPLYSDVTTLDSSLLSSGVEVLCNIQYKRFYKGQRVAFVEPHFKRRDFGVLANAIYGEIKEVYGTGFTLVDPLVFTMGRGTMIFPMIDIHPGLKYETNLMSDETIVANIKTHELDGQSALPASWGEDVSQLFSYYEGNPIFKLDTNWASRVQQEFVRAGTSFYQGRANHTELHATVPQIQVSISELDITREEAWELLRFFDSRRGRTNPFWIIQPLTTHSVFAITSTYVDIPAWDYLDNLQTFMKYIGFEDTSRNLHIRKVSSIVLQAPDRFRVTFNDPFTSVPTVAKVAPAWLSNFTQDNLEQGWKTNHHSSCRLSTLQVLDEATYSIL